MGDPRILLEKDHETRIVDPESREPLARERPGEIEVRGPNLMRGISGRLREATFTRDGCGLQDLIRKAGEAP